jgi:hypothetical protein
VSTLERIKAEQYMSRNSLSDYAVAQALAFVHVQLVPTAGKYGDIEVMHFSDEQLRRYLGTALRESRQIDLCHNKLVHMARHPEGERGSAMAHCVICSQGANPKLPLPVEADDAGNAAELLHPANSSRCGKVQPPLLPFGAFGP